MTSPERNEQVEDESGMPDLAVSLLVCVILYAAYLLTFNGAPISDDEQLFLSTAQHVAVFGEFDAPLMYGNDRMSGEFDGVGPAHPAIASLAVRGVWPSRLGSVQAQYLLPALYTAGTGAILYLLGRRFRFSSMTCLIGVFIYGLATLAWPYALTFFREPLAALFLTAAWLSFELATDHRSSTRLSAVAWIFFTLFITGAMLSKVVTVIALPGFAVLAWRRGLVAHAFSKARKRRFILIALVLFSISLWILTFGIDEDQAGIFYRYTGAFARFVLDRAQMTSHQNFFSAILGALVSPGKGLFMYSPILLLLVLAFVVYDDDRISLFGLPLTVLLGLILTQSYAYDSAWWTITWSTRFLLPAVPLLIIAILPAVERLHTNSQRWVRAAFWILVLVSSMFQIAGFAVSPTQYSALRSVELASKWPDAYLWNPGEAPLLGHIGLVLDGEANNLSWIRIAAEQPTRVAPVVLLIGGIILSGFWLLYKLMRKKNRQLWMSIAMVFSAIALVFLSYATLSASRVDPYYHVSRNDLNTAIGKINSRAKEGDVILIRSYLYPVWNAYFNFGRARAQAYSLPLDGRISGNYSILPEQQNKTETLVRALPDQTNRVWHLSEDVLAFPVQSEEIALLKDIYEFEQTWSFGDESTVILTLYERNP